MILRLHPTISSRACLHAGIVAIASKAKQQRWVYLPRYTTTMSTTIKWNYVLIFRHSNELHYVYTPNTRRRKKTDSYSRSDGSRLFYFPPNHSSLVDCVFPHTSDRRLLTTFPECARINEIQTVSRVGGKRVISPRSASGTPINAFTWDSRTYKTHSQLRVVAHLVI